MCDMATSCRRALVVSGICVLNLIVLAQALPTSQYLGPAINGGDQHVLLLELPNSISTKILQQQPSPKYYPSPLVQPQYRPLRDSIEQNVALTIPLSNLQPVEPHPVYQTASIIQPTPEIVYKNERYQPTRVEYPSHASAEPYTPEYQRTKSETAALSNLTSVLEQQVRQYIQQYHLRRQLHKSNQYANLKHGDPVSIIPPLPIGEYPQPTLDQIHYNLRHYNASSDNSSVSLLYKLAHSSPELLVRLKNFLQQANLSDDKPSIKYGSSKNPYDISSTYPSESQELYTDKEKHSSAESTYLTNHNLTSHEEIKIPLVVIAMPRILTTKKGQHAAAGTGNHTLHQLISSALSNFTAGGANHSANYHPIVASKLLQLIRQQPYNNYTGLNSTYGRNYSDYLDTNHIIPLDTTTSLPLHTMAPYAQEFTIPLATPIGRQHQPYNTNFYNQPSYFYPGQIKSVPAPYNSSTYLTSQQQPLLYQVYHHQDQIRQSLPKLPEIKISEPVNLTHWIPSPPEYHQEQDFSHYPKPDEEQSIRQQIEEITNFLRAAQEAEKGGGGGGYIQLPELDSDKSGRLPYLAPVPYAAAAHPPAANLNSPVPHSLFVPYSALQRIYNLQMQKRHQSNYQHRQYQNSNVSSELSPPSYQHIPLLPIHQPAHVMANRSIISHPPQLAINIIEPPQPLPYEMEGNSKLRPLFQTITRRSNNAVPAEGSKLTNGQLLSLFAAHRNYERPGELLSQQTGPYTGSTNNNAFYGGGVGDMFKKNPGMVFMIV